MLFITIVGYGSGFCDNKSTKRPPFLQFLGSGVSEMEASRIVGDTKTMISSEAAPVWLGSWHHMFHCFVKHQLLVRQTCIFSFFRSSLLFFSSSFSYFFFVVFCSFFLFMFFFFSFLTPDHSSLLPTRPRFKVP